MGIHPRLFPMPLRDRGLGGMPIGEPGPVGRQVVRKPGCDEQVAPIDVRQSDGLMKRRQVTVAEL